MVFIRSELHFQVDDLVYLKDPYKIVSGTFSKGHEFKVCGFQNGVQMDPTDFLKVKSTENDKFTNGTIYTIDKSKFTRSKPITANFYDR